MKNIFIQPLKHLPAALLAHGIFRVIDKRNELVYKKPFNDKQKLASKFKK